MTQAQNFSRLAQLALASVCVMFATKSDAQITGLDGQSLQLLLFFLDVMNVP